MTLRFLSASTIKCTWTKLLDFVYSCCSRRKRWCPLRAAVSGSITCDNVPLVSIPHSSLYREKKSLNPKKSQVCLCNSQDMWTAESAACNLHSTNCSSFAVSQEFWVDTFCMFLLLHLIFSRGFGRRFLYNASLFYPPNVMSVIYSHESNQNMRH